MQDFVKDLSPYEMSAHFFLISVEMVAVLTPRTLTDVIVTKVSEFLKMELNV